MGIMNRSKTGMVILGIIVALLVIGGWFVSTNNRLISMDEAVKGSWSQVENVYQRRADLIPNLVSTVKGYAKHEAEVFEKVAQARANAGQIQVKSAEDLKAFDQAQAQLKGALSRLLVVAERYPELKANQGFLELQSQLEGTENRISIERMRFNETAQTYNAYIRKIPQNFVASLRGFQPRAYFAADAGAKTAPKVEF